MSLIKDIILEELERLEKLLKVKEVDFNKIPKGSLRQKIIGNNTFFYRVYRQNGKVISEYLCRGTDKTKAEYYIKENENRKLLKNEIKMLKQEIKKLRRSVDKLG